MIASLYTRIHVGLLWLLVATNCPWGADLKQVYELARERDTQRQAAEAAFLSTLELKPQAVAPLLPWLNLDANVTRIDQDVSGGDQTLLSDPDDTVNTSSYAVSLSQIV